VNREPTADAAGLHERASATPEHARVNRQARLGSAPRWAAGELSLRSQQEWFFEVITTPELEPAPVDASSAGHLVAPSSTLSSLARLEIYRRSYQARLVECLADDYPVLQETLGEETFERLCRAYITKHPSTEPSLNRFGRHMADFCRAHPLPEPQFAADLASLEWAVVLAIHAPTAAPLTSEELMRIPAERWPETRLVPNPSLGIHAFGYPVSAYFSARRRGEAVAPPAARPTSVAVYRTERSVWRLELTPPMVTLVESLSRGETLDAALSLVAAQLEGVSEAEAARSVTSWFSHAVSSGLFSGVRAQGDG
jgi:hypothetical protein